MGSRKKKRVLLIHNFISPYRLPIFEELNKFVDLEVLFCKISPKNRSWTKKELDFYNFKYSNSYRFSLSKIQTYYLIYPSKFHL